MSVAIKMNRSMPVPYERRWVGASQFKSIFALTHPTAVLIFGLMVAVLICLAVRGIPPTPLFFLLPIAMMLGQAAIGISNEVVDCELDRAAKPWRALPAGLISRRMAIALAIGCGLLGLAGAFVVSLPSAIVYLVGISMGVLYSTTFKYTVFSGVPYLIAYPLLPIWVWVSLGEFRLPQLAIYPLALPLVLAIHLVNQLRDFDEDQRIGFHSLVQSMGKTRATTLCSMLLLLCPFALWLPSIWLRTLPAFAAVLLCSLFHLGVIGSFLYTRRGETGPEIFRGLFKRLQLSGPLMLVCCFLLLGT